MEQSTKPIWTPAAKLRESCAMNQFMTRQGFQDYESLWRWSIEKREQFWSNLWDDFQIIGDKGKNILEKPDDMPGAKWFTDSRLNFAENLLCSPLVADNNEAIVFYSEAGKETSLDRGQIKRSAGNLAAWMRAQGIQKGDRVACCLPNIPEAMIAMLAANSIGAVWSSASPDFGVTGICERFVQIKPKLFFCVDGYCYSGKSINCLDKFAEVCKELTTLDNIVLIPFLEKDVDISCIPGAINWSSAIYQNTQQELQFTRVEFDHPLFILFSSGTTGKPKCIVHGTGGTLLQHLKEHRLHGDMRPGDRFFYFTTCGWMMWNWLVTGLASGATLLLYDGHPFATPEFLFDLAAKEKISHFGTSAKYLEGLQKFNVKPAQSHDLKNLRVMFSTGSPLSIEGFEYVYRDIKSDLMLASISGGTDIVSCFVLGNPLLPIYAGEIQCRGLGMATDVFDEAGKPLKAGKGELVCTKPFPAMPVSFWNDADGKLYNAAYFDRFANVWCHGDFAEVTSNNGIIIHGRSDTTLNPGGVRIGTAEIYRQVEQIPEVFESLVIGQEWERDVRVVLFVHLKEGEVLNEELIRRIKQQIRQNTSPRHVPSVVLAVEGIPRTKSGKIVELAVKNVVEGHEVKNANALANPETLAYFENREELMK